MSEIQTSSNKRIAKNTIMLYIRMLLSIVVSLYTSRVVLQTLGVNDYGIYGVVGGIVSMFSFLNAAMSGSTSRFLTFEIGKGNAQKLKDTFSSAMLVHVLIALGVFIIAETFGLWFLCNKLVIPEERMFAAHIVYQFSIVSMFFSVTQVPYNATILAHEKMDVYAYVELLNVFLKLGIVYLLVIGNLDKLIFYAALTLAVSIFIAIIYRIYCLYHYEESSFNLVWDKSILKPMLGFSGWDMFGNMSVVAFYQGISFIFNIFFGPALNAANSISLTVQGTIKGFALNVIQAFRPQIIINYAKGEINAVEQYTIMATQYTLILFSFIAIPIYFNAELILKLWLGTVPTYTSAFLKIIMIATLFDLCKNALNIPIHATAKMTFFSISTGCCLLLTIPVMYFSLKLGAEPPLSYAVVIISYSASMLASLYVVKRNIKEFNILRLCKDAYFKYIFYFATTTIVCYHLSMLISNKWIYLGLTLFISILLGCICMLFLMMTMNDRKKLYSLVASKIQVM